MYNDDRNDMNRMNQDDMFDEADVRIPDDTDAHIYRKVEEDGSLAQEASHQFGRQPEANPAPESHDNGTAQQQTQWQGSTYRRSYVNQETQNTQQAAGTNQQSYQNQQSAKQPYSYRPDSGQNGNDRKKSHKRGNSGQHGHMNPFVRSVLCGVIIGVIAGGCVLGSFAIGNQMKGNETASASAAEIPMTGENLEKETTPAPVKEKTEASAGTYTVSEIAAQCQSSVVAITNKGVQEVYTFFGKMEQENEGSGSGVIVGKNESELLIVTNNHVVEGAQELTVCFNDDENAVYEAQVKGTDPKNDLAVVAIPLDDISADVMGTISIATLGDSNTLKVGDDVVAIGNALGMGQSVTKGVISATSREVTIEGLTATLLQTDAAINPGNSGGALFNMKGELIGINSAKFASSAVEGMGFAIPISSAQPIMDELMNRTTRTKLSENYGYLNITGKDVSADVSEMYGVPSGVYIAAVVSGGAAQKAGIQEGDILTTLDGIAITSIEQLKSELTYYEAGTTVDVIIQRNSGQGYEEITLQVTLDSELDTQSVPQQEDTQQEQTVPEEEVDPFSQFFQW